MIKKTGEKEREECDTVRRGKRVGWLGPRGREEGESAINTRRSQYFKNRSFKSLFSSLFLSFSPFFFFFLFFFLFFFSLTLRRY